ncbi:MAG: hypothetical protein P4N59_18340 [Negativicutes bacterium]|nr:hypothetical protein [Negativicutes bacterium]
MNRFSTFLLTLVFFFVAFQSYELVQYYSIPQNIWTYGVYPVLVIVFGIVIIIWSKKPRGKVTPWGIRIVGRTGEIPIAEIKKIYHKDWQTVIETADGEAKTRLPVSELVTLSNGRLNEWRITENSLVIVPEASEKPFRSVYAPIGKYAVNPSVMSWLFALGYLLFIFRDVILQGIEYSIAYFILLLVAQFFFRRYKPFTVTLDDTGLTLQDEKGRQQSLAFAEVAQVEKGIFRTTVTAKDGEVLHFPRGCYLLPELIEELAGLGHPK